MILKLLSSLRLDAYAALLLAWQVCSTDSSTFYARPAQQAARGLTLPGDAQHSTLHVHLQARVDARLHDRRLSCMRTTRAADADKASRCASTAVAVAHLLRIGHA
jgi:hypothetical protein